MTDPIKTALDVAVRQLCARMWREEPCPQPCRACRESAAVALTAFLRALPARFPMQRPGGQSCGHSTGEMARLANLVEQAARDE
jgi:hypothetical protein